MNVGVDRVDVVIAKKALVGDTVATPTDVTGDVSRTSHAAIHRHSTIITHP